MIKTVIGQIAQSLQALENCRQSNNKEWAEKHVDTILDTIEKYLPNGSGINSGVELDFARSKPDRIVFLFDFFPIVDQQYAEAINFRLTVTPSFVNDIEQALWYRVVRRGDVPDIEDYIYQTFRTALTRNLEAGE